MSGGPGDDYVYVEGDREVDYVDCGPGLDFVQYDPFRFGGGGDAYIGCESYRPPLLGDAMSSGDAKGGANGRTTN